MSRAANETDLSALAFETCIHSSRLSYLKLGRVITYSQRRNMDIAALCVQMSLLFFSNFPLLTSIPYCDRITSLCCLFLISLLYIDMQENSQSHCNHSEFPPSHHSSKCLQSGIFHLQFRMCLENYFSLR